MKLKFYWMFGPRFTVYCRIPLPGGRRIIGLSEGGVWWDDKDKSTHLLRWAKIPGAISKKLKGTIYANLQKLRRHYICHR